MDKHAELTRSGEQLGRVPEQQRLSLADLTARTGISTKRIARLEAGLSDPRFDALCALSQGLGVGLSGLFPEDDE
ncbi:MAG: helix-turn-helix domain-containing protein [Solirubrobacteraceae bacterium]